MKTILREYFKRTITKDQCKDTGMAVTLLLLLLSFPHKREGLVVAATIILVVNMIYPQVYRPVAVVWLGLSHLLGTLMSKILLTIVFFVVVTPIGLVRRFLGKDSMQLKAFRASQESVMVARNHTFVPEDIEKPY